jgi:hypothetical protein
MAEPSDAARRQRTKNIAIGLTVAAVCVLFFIITIVRMGMN